MKPFLRVLVVSAVGVSALALAGSALAAFTTPKLSITNTAAGLTVGYTQVKDDDALNRLTIYMPTGYAASLAAAPGSTVGSVTSVVQANAISADALVPLNGTIRVDSPTAATHNEPLDVACRGGVAANAVWVLVLQSPTGPLEVPVYVIAITSGPEAAFASGKLVLCLPSPYIPTSAGGAALGAKVINAQMTIQGVFTAPTAAGEYRWRGIATPYTVGSGAPNAVGTVELQATQAVPGGRVSIASRRRGKTVTISGRVTSGGSSVAGAPVQIFRGARVVKTVRTSASGAYSYTVRLRRGGYTFSARATVPARDLGAAGCATAISAAPCIDATASGFRAQSAVVRVRVR